MTDLQAWLAVCVLAYGGGLLVLYLFAFNENEGPSLAGMGRYLGIPALGLACALFAWALRTADRSGRGRLSLVACSIMVAGFGYTMSADAIKFVQTGAAAETDTRRHVQDVVAPQRGWSST